MTDLPTIELRRISVNGRLSRETACYAASLFVDGRHVCDVSNEGRGGADVVDKPGKGLTWREASDLYAALDRQVRTDFPQQDVSAAGEPASMVADSLEYLCARIVGRHQLLKALRRDLSRNLLFYADGLPTAEGETPLRMIRLDGAEPSTTVARLRLRHPAAYVLNEQTEEDALAAYALMA